MTRVFGSRRQPGAFFFLKHQTQNKKRAAEGAVETATAVEIDKGGLRHLLLDDSHKLFGKASAKTAPALPPLPQCRRLLSSSEGAITNKPPNTKFKLLPAHEPESPTDTERMMEEICEWENLKEAIGQVKANKGSAGIDGITVDELPHYREWEVIREQLLSGSYKPQPVKRVEIPKPDGGVRKLGIPTVLDRVVQQAVMQVLQKRWDRAFSDQQFWFSSGPIGASGRSAGAEVYRRRLRMGGGLGFGEILRSSQPRQTDGADRETDRGQTAVETHSGVPKRRGDGKRISQSKRGRHSARRSSHSPYTKGNFGRLALRNPRFASER